MSNIYYDNIDDSLTQESRYLAQNVYYNLQPMMSYLVHAIRSLNSSAMYVKWKVVDTKKIKEAFVSNEIENQSSLEKEQKLTNAQIQERVKYKLEQGFWVQIIAPKEFEEKHHYFNLFYESQSVYDSMNFIQSSKIEIVDFDENLELLCLHVPPSNDADQSRLYIRPDTMGLQKQIDAIIKLEDKPHTSQRGLYRLFETEDTAKWEKFKTRTPSKWFVLTDANRPGIDEQRKFVEIALGTPDFAVLEGPPGSGKTTVITELIAQLLREGKRVLLCGSTHVAVDNVLERMKDIPGAFAVRVGPVGKISSEVKQFQINHRLRTAADDLIKLISSAPEQTESKKMLLSLAQQVLDSTTKTYSHPFFRLMLESANLVCGTTIGLISKIAIFNSVQEGRTDPLFDVMILDEASKTPFTEFLVPAVWAKKWILAGDIKQLSPYVNDEEVRANVDGLFRNEIGQSIVMNGFRTRGYKTSRGKPLLIIDEDQDYQRNVILQAYRTGLVISVLNDRIREFVLSELKSEESSHPLQEDLQCGHIVNPASFDMQERLLAAGCDIVIGSELDFKRLPDAVPHSTKEVVGDIAHPSICGRYAWYNFRKSTGHPEKSWSEEVTWRLTRRHELKLKKNDNKRELYLHEITRMLPWYLDYEKVTNIKRRLFEIESIALPSIIELLQYGYASENVEYKNALKTGLPPHIFAERHVTLSFQHRMHPDISRFPRIHFYDGISLNDPDYMIDERQWPYEKKLGENRSLWLHVNYQAKTPSTTNEFEADALIEELRKFCQWAKLNPKKAGEPWEVAVLTFYRGQERLFRNRIGNEFDKLPDRTYWYPNEIDRYVRIEVCSVDRFQGHEADMVLLSLVNTNRIGFIDSPNRVNVALTRAKYQLIVIGNRNFFKSRTDAGALHNLAHDEKVKPYRTYEPRKHRDHKSTKENKWKG